MDNKMLMDLARQLGFPEDKAQDKLNQYKDKSDEEILRELNKIKQVIQKDRSAYEKQIIAIKALAQSMTGQQKARLQKLIELLGI